MDPSPDGIGPQQRPVPFFHGPSHTGLHTRQCTGVTQFFRPLHYRYVWISSRNWDRIC